MIEAELITGDLKDNTMTFQVQGELILKAGNYTILTKQEYEELKLLRLGDVSKSFNRRNIKRRR